MDNGLALACNNVEIGVVFFCDVFGTHVTVYFFCLIVVFENLASV
jgi:hypothetical protein